MYKFLLFLFIIFFIGCEEKSEKYIPTAQTIENKLYLFGIHPYLNPLDLDSAYNPIMKYLEKHTGAVFKLQASNNYEHFEDKLYKGEFDFALPNPYQTVLSLKHSYKVIAKMAPDDDFRGIIVSRIDNNIKSPKDLIGKKVSFPAKTALAATMMPLYFLYENGVDVNRDIEKKFVGSQYSSILNAYTKDSFAGATWPPPWREWSKANPEKAKEMVLLWQTEPLPNNGVVVKNSVDIDFANSVAEILANMNKNDEGRAILKNAGFSFFEEANNSYYEPVIDFLKIYEDKIGFIK